MMILTIIKINVLIIWNRFSRKDAKAQRFVLEKYTDWTDETDLLGFFILSAALSTLGILGTPNFRHYKY